MTSAFPVGGNPPLAESLLTAAPVFRADGCLWTASGRDAYLVVAQLTGAQRWYLPEFLCAVVPQTLQGAGLSCIPYRTGCLSEAWTAGRPDGISVVCHDVADGPHPNDLRALEETQAPSVEDRCLWALPPAAVPGLRRNAFVIGSLRKWTGVAEGGWLRAESPAGFQPRFTNSPPREHILAQLAAGALRRLRLEGADEPFMDEANRKSSAMAEDLLGIPVSPRPISKLGFAMAQLLGDVTGEASLRGATAQGIAGILSDSEWCAAPGVLGIRVHCSRRDALLARLIEGCIYAPVHWRDGDWADRGGRAAELAERTLTLPCPPLDDGLRSSYLERLSEALNGFDVRIDSATRVGS